MSEKVTTMQDVAAAEIEERAAAELPGTAAELATIEAQRIAEAMEGGLKEQTAITFGSLLPHPTFAAEQSLGKPRGQTIRLGRVMGTAVSTERKQTMFGGKLLESIALIGDFHAVSELRPGEILHGSMLFLTNTYSQQIERALKESAETGEAAVIDVDVGLETTGKSPVSYAWTIHHWLTGMPSRAIRDLLTPRKTAPKALPPVI